MNAKNALSKLKETLIGKVENHIHETALILAFSTGSSLEEIYSHPEMKISELDFQKAMKVAENRASGKPLAYIFGKKEFYGLDFSVNSSVLIPRPETEMMVDEVVGLVKNFPENKKLLVIDIGTGSGCIPISIAKNIEHKNIQFMAMDISEKALEVARKNSEKHGIANRIKLIKSDLLEKLFASDNQCSMLYDTCSMVVTANLPYLSEKIYDNCPKSVKEFEPKEALLSGEDGLDHYRRLFKQIIEERLAERCSFLEIILEISPEQKDLVKETIEEKFGDKVKISFKKDLAGKWRLAKIVFNK